MQSSFRRPYHGPQSGVFFGFRRGGPVRFVLVFAAAWASLAAGQSHQGPAAVGRANSPKTEGKHMELATFGGGCFWCLEAVFDQLDGVKSVTSGYAGGATPHPTYEQVCSGTTGHAEVVQIEFDPSVISYERLLEVFWQCHDPTTLNRQGPDFGTQYRSCIFHHSPEQKEVAERMREQLDKAKVFADPIVTTIEPLEAFYPAEKYHQDYFRLNARQPYCQAVVRPKVEKIRKAFADALK